MQQLKLINLVIESLLFGYCLFSIAKSLITLIFKNNPQFLSESVDNTVVLITRYTGIVFLFLWIYGWITLYTENLKEIDNYAITNRLFGPHWYGYWMRPFSYFVLTQLLWISLLRKSKVYRIITAILILFAILIEDVILIITSFERDYIPSSWVYEKKSQWGVIWDLTIFWFTELGIFMFIICIIEFLKRRKNVA